MPPPRERLIELLKTLPDGEESDGATSVQGQKSTNLLPAARTRPDLTTVGSGRAVADEIGLEPMTDEFLFKPVRDDDLVRLYIDLKLNEVLWPKLVDTTP